MVRETSWVLLSGALMLTAAAPACGQTMNTNSASFNGGYGRVDGSENQPVSTQLVGPQGNLQDSSGLASGLGGGAIDTSSGAGGTVTNLGGSLTVVTQDGSSAVTITSSQTSTGTVLQISAN